MPTLTPVQFAHKARPILKQIDRLQGKVSQRKRLMGFYELARLIRKAAGDRSKYDGQTLSKLGKAIGWSADQMCRMRKLAVAYPGHEQFKELVKLAPNAPRTFFIRLAGVPGKNKQRRLAARFGNGKATTAEIYRRLRAERRRSGRENLETPSGGGRRLKKRSPGDLVRELRQRVESMQRLWRESRGSIVRRRRKSIPWRQNSKPPDDLVKLLEAIEILRSEIQDRVAKRPRQQSR